MLTKTSDLIGPALDWAVWSCVGGCAAYPKTATGKAFLKLWYGNSAKYIHPSTDWAQGGPIIERERIFCKPTLNKGWRSYQLHTAGTGICNSQYGPTPLIAAMRCYVASKLGDEVEVPDDLA